MLKHRLSLMDQNKRVSGVPFPGLALSSGFSSSVPPSPVWPSLLPKKDGKRNKVNNYTYRGEGSIPIPWYLFINPL